MTHIVRFYALLTAVLFLSSVPCVIAASAQDSLVRSLLLRDSLHAASGEAGAGTTAPGEYPFTPAQDRRYYESLALPLSAQTRFRLEARRVFDDARAKPDAKLSMSEIARHNVDIQSLVSPFEMPEVREYKEHLSHSFSIPGIKTFGVLPGLFEKGNLGFITDAFREDTSPILRYTLDETALVNVSVFSQQAARVRLLFQGAQPVGSYSHVWNERNDDGARVATGDYVGIVSVGTKTALRKRIRVD